MKTHQTRYNNNNNCLFIHSETHQGFTYNKNKNRSKLKILNTNTKFKYNRYTIQE